MKTEKLVQDICIATVVVCISVALWVRFERLCAVEEQAPWPPAVAAPIPIFPGQMFAEPEFTHLAETNWSTAYLEMISQGHTDVDIIVNDLTEIGVREEQIEAIVDLVDREELPIASVATMIGLHLRGYTDIWKKTLGEFTARPSANYGSNVHSYSAL